MNHLIAAVERSLQTGNHYAALAMALTLPDICGWILNPNVGSKVRYISWFEKYLQPQYTRPASLRMAEHVFLTGADCYALRCAYLHEGRDDITDQHAQQVLESFQFVVPPQGWLVHRNQMNNTLQLQLDVFCREVTEAVAAFLAEITLNQAATLRLGQLLLIRDINGQPLQVGP